MKLKNLLTLILLTALETMLWSQKITISGWVEDSTSSEKLISATVYDASSKLGTTTNNSGFFSLTVPAKAVNLNISFVGYEPIVFSKRLKRDTIVTFQLTPTSALREVEVNAKREDRIENRMQMSQVALPIEQIKKIPTLIGEVDILKALQFTPGVKMGSEGSTGLYVRGGSNDQNLVLLDGVSVYNASHVGGYFSVFNGDAIKNVRLTTGGFPARFGGRLSSVVEIDMKEGNMKTFHAEGGVGILSSRLLLEGPIVPDKVSFMFAARRSYADIYLKPIRARKADNNGEQLIDYALYFYDVNAKINYKINDRNQVYASYYQGLDKYNDGVKQLNYEYPFNYSINDKQISWGNSTSSLRWNSLISNKLFLNATLSRSTYFFEENNINEQQLVIKLKPFDLATASNVLYNSNVKDYAAKLDFDYVPNTKNHFRFGFGATYHTFSPGNYATHDVFLSTPYDLNIAPVLATKDSLLGNPKISAVEPFAYIEDEISFDKFTINVGLHIASFFVQNSTYPTVQPRLSLLYKLPNEASLKASISTMQQNVHLLTNDGLGFPTDLWVTSTDRIKPQQSWQVALGYAQTIKDNYSFSTEVYYKRMNNVLSYKEGTSFLDRLDVTPWEDKVTQGIGEAYGAEFFLRKLSGKTTGWISYTLAWNNRQFTGINNDNWFPFRYDRRHELSIVVNQQLSKRWSFSANFVLQSSNPVTPPVSVFRYPVINPSLGNYEYFYTEVVYGARNSFRPTISHRLDVGFDYTVKFKKWESKISIGAYNVYNHANAYYYNISVENQNPNIAATASQPIKYSLRQISGIPIIPSLTYNFKF